MSNGRHFNPPTPAYRPRDPFSSFEPRSAERVPSCETTRPPPSRPRPVRVEPAARGPVGVPASVSPAVLAGQGVKEEPVRAQGAAGPVHVDRQEVQEVSHRVPAVEQAPVVLDESAVEAMSLSESAAPAAEIPASAPAAVHEPEPEQVAVAEAPAAEEGGSKSRRKGKAKPETKIEDKPEAKIEDKPVKAAKSQSRRKQAAPEAEPEQPEPEEAQAEPEVLAGEEPLKEGEEVRVCEWEKCGKRFVVKTGGRTVVRRFCSGTCRGRASEARTGKRKE